LKSGYANLPIGGLLDAIRENGVPRIAAQQCQCLGKGRQVRESIETRSLGFKFNQDIANRNTADVLGNVNYRWPESYEIRN
jgi:hypothetical protein